MKNVFFENPDLEKLRKKYMLIDMHNHTEASHDCSTKVKLIGERLRALKLGISITDHNAIKGALALRKQFPKQLILPGIEVTTKEDKDILLYFHTFSDLKEFYDKNIFPKIKVHRTNAFTNNTTITNEEMLAISSWR